jgi:hypothetical protein
VSFPFPVIAAIVTAGVAFGQTNAGAPAWIQKLIPRKARVIEMAELHGGKADGRALLLWMLHPKRVMRQGNPGCSDWVYGDHWCGPVRLSLIDLRNKKVVNTVEIRGLNEGGDEPEHGFPIPFRVSDEFYHVPEIDKNKEGAPRILNLRDLTGEGVVGQFVLFEYLVCGVSYTTVLGYSSRTDAAVQFRVEVSAPGEKTETVSWVPHLFQEAPARPGYWNFTWEPGHGADCEIHEEVVIDQNRQLFVDHRTITPSPDAPPRQKR